MLTQLQVQLIGYIRFYLTLIYFGICWKFSSLNHEMFINTTHHCPLKRGVSVCLFTFLLFFSSVGPRIYYMDYFCVSSCFIDWILVFTTFLCFYGIGSRNQFPRRQCKVSCSLPYSLNKEITGLRLFRQDIDTFHGNLGMILLQFSKVYT